MRSERSKPILVLSVILCVAMMLLIAVEPSLGAETKGSDLERILKAKKLIVGLEVAVKKRASMDPVTKKPVGYEVDLAYEIGRRMGVEVEIIDLPWSGLIPALVSGRIDMIGSTMARLEGRALAVDFTFPTVRSGEVIIVRQDDNRFKTIMDANKKGIRVGATLGTGGEMVARKLFTNAEIKTYEAPDQVGLAVATKQIDVWMDDDYYLSTYAEDHPNLKVVGLESPVNAVTCGLAVRRGSDLLPWLNLFLYNVKQEGYLTGLLEKWGLPVVMNAPWDPTGM